MEVTGHLCLKGELLCFPSFSVSQYYYYRSFILNSDSCKATEVLIYGLTLSDSAVRGVVEDRGSKCSGRQRLNIQVKSLLLKINKCQSRNKKRH